MPMPRNLPPDIDPHSGFRLPLPRREDLDDAGKIAFDRAAAPGKSIVGLRGPGGITLYSPKTANVRTEFNNYLRYDVFDPKTREVAIMTVAREMDSQFEWAAHEPEALKEGVPQNVIDVIKHRKSTQGLDETYAAIIELGRQAFGDHKVTSECFARVKKAVRADKTRRAGHADGQLRRHRGAAARGRHAVACRLETDVADAVRHNANSDGL